MGTIVLHAGTPKAGSSSIQTWLRQNDALLSDAGWHVVTYRVDDTTGEATVSPARGGGVNSATIVRDYARSGRNPATLDRFFQPLDQLAADLGNVVVTGEGFARPFAEVDEPFLTRLESLASNHEVRVAYYVRAQHEALEAAWRQWGFRSRSSPSEYVRMRAQRLDYRATFDGMAQILREAQFGMRLFHRGAIHGTDVVADFANTFMRTDINTTKTAVWANPGLPLELAIALAGAEPGRFWTSVHDGRIIQPLKELVADWDLPESDDIRQSRAILQQFCFDRFERDNQALIRELRWPIEHLVPPIEQNGSPSRDLAELDHLWCSSLSSTEREMLFAAIEQALASNGHLARIDWRRPHVPTAADGSLRETEEGKRRALAPKSSGATPEPTVTLARDGSGKVYVLEPTGRRLVRSRILANGLEVTFGAARQIERSELARWADAEDVELVRGRDGHAYVELDGIRHPVRGVPLARLAPDNLDAPRGQTIDLAKANVAEPGETRTTGIRGSLHRASSAMRRHGLVGATRRAIGRFTRSVESD
jgi:hypothetical protein